MNIAKGFFKCGLTHASDFVHFTCETFQIFQKEKKQMVN